MKTCGNCKVEFPLSNFAEKRNVCKGCRKTYKRERDLMVLYGVSAIEFQQMLSEQDFACAICRKPFGDVEPHLDHDHQTGFPRGLLDANCNRALGLFGDNEENLKRAVAYLAR